MSHYSTDSNCCGNYQEITNVEYFGENSMLSETFSVFGLYKEAGFWFCSCPISRCS